MIKVIFFDMGNTLLHFHEDKSDEEKDELGLRYLTDYLKKYVQNISYEEVKSEFFHKWDGVMELRKTNQIEYPVEDFLNGLMKKYHIQLSIEKCIEAMNSFYTEYRNYVKTESNIHVTLKELKIKGYKIGVISNACMYDEIMINCFKKAGIHKYIDEYTFSYYLRKGKPRKEIFEHALRKMKINSSEAIMIGDNLKSDIEAAQKLGMKTIWFNKDNKINETNIKPDIEIQNISDILKKQIKIF